MIKREELTNPNSCMSRALPDERTFVLLARDECAPIAIRGWIMARISRGKNTITDPQLVEALECAEAMEAERGGVKNTLAALLLADSMTPVKPVCSTCKGHPSVLACSSGLSHTRECLGGCGTLVCPNCSAPQPATEAPDGKCPVCDWPLRATAEEGCVPGNCSYRPHEGTDEYRRIQQRRKELAAQPATGQPQRNTCRHCGLSTLGVHVCGPGAYL